MTVVDLARFDGGLNTRDSLEELGRNETPDAVNKTLTTRGAVVVRNGCALAVTLPAGTASFLYYSASLDKWYCQVGTELYRRPGDLSGSWTDITTVSLTTSATVAMVDFQGVVVIVHPVDGVYTHDGGTGVITSRNVSTVGNSIAVFKNRVWVGGTTDPGLRTRIWFSNIGTAVTWTTATDFVDIREKDDQPLTALAGSPGALLVFKQRSAYRITDAATGAYQTIDGSAGCVGAQATANLNGRVYTWGADGIYSWDGIGPGKNVGDRIRPVYFLGDLAGLVSAEAFEDRIVFAINFGQAPGPDLYELHAEQGWIVKHTLASNEQVTSLATKGMKLYASTGASMYEMFTGTPGSDNSVNYTSNYRTPPLNLGKLHRLQRARVYGKSASSATSTKELRTYKDWGTSVADTFDITSLIESSDGEEAIDLRGLGHAEAFQLEFRCTGGTGTAELDRLLLDLTPLAS
jgi:hypothetical protein